MRDVESIPFEYWLNGNNCIGIVTAHQCDDEHACKARVALAYEAMEQELNSWMDFGDHDDTVTINIRL